MHINFIVSVHSNKENTKSNHETKSEKNKQNVLATMQSRKG